MRSLRLLTAVFTTCVASLLVAQEKPTEASPSKADSAPKSAIDELREKGVKVIEGPATVALGKAAELKLPVGHQFIGPDSLDRFYQLTQNQRGGNEVGVVLAEDYMLYFDYEAVGYVKDEDKDKLDADKLLKSLNEGQEAANEERKEQGWSQLKLNGWATTPYYDAKTNNLKWAIKLSSSRDNYKKVFINESIRLLGRGGVMNATLAVGTEGFKTAETAADKLLADNFSYVSGEKYSEFKAGDKVAAYGLSALVLGGAGVLAAKAGLFAKLGVFFGKFWKALVFVLVALGAAIKKFFSRLTGSQPRDPSV